MRDLISGLIPLGAAKLILVSRSNVTHGVIVQTEPWRIFLDYGVILTAWAMRS